jgi:hypothetical protein
LEDVLLRHPWVPLYLLCLGALLIAVICDSLRRSEATQDRQGPAVPSGVAQRETLLELWENHLFDGLQAPLCHVFFRGTTG